MWHGVFDFFLSEDDGESKRLHAGTQNILHGLYKWNQSLSLARLMCQVTLCQRKNDISYNVPFDREELAEFCKWPITSCTALAIDVTACYWTKKPNWVKEWEYLQNPITPKDQVFTHVHIIWLDNLASVSW